jgi:outer membrane protein
MLHLPQQPANMVPTAFICWFVLLFSAPTIVLAQEAAATQPTNAQLTLNDAISQTLATNPASLAAAEQVRQAESAVGIAEAGQRFQLSFTSTSSVSSANVIQPPPASETFGAIQNSLTIPIPLGPKAELASREAMEQLNTAQENFQSEQIALAQKVVDAYYDLLRKEALVTVAQQDLDTANREFNDAEARNKAGDIPDVDVLQAQVPVATANAALLQAHSASSIAQETLNDLLGRLLDEPLALADVSAPIPVLGLTLDQARTAAAQRSPDVASAAFAVKSAKTALDAVKRYNDPSLSLQAIDLRSGDQTSFSREDTIAASISAPIDDGGLSRSMIHAAEDAVSQAEYNLASVQKTVNVAVSADYLTVQASVAEVNAAQQARDIAQTTYDKTRLGFVNGLYPLVDVITAENSVAQARTAYVQALYDAVNAQSVLDLEVHGLPVESMQKSSH